MLTVKYVDPDGPERVFAVKEIEYVADSYLCQVKGTEIGRARSNGRLRFVYPDGSDFYVYGGTIYAMNENGKTVAKYDLGGERLTGEKAADVAKIYTGATLGGRVQTVTMGG